MAWYDYDYPYLAKVFAELVRRRNALTTQDGTLSQYNFTTLGTNPSDDALVGASLGGKNPTNFIRDFFAEMKLATDVSRPWSHVYYDCAIYGYSWGFATPMPTVPAEIDPNDWDTWVGHCRTTIDSFYDPLTYYWDMPADQTETTGISLNTGGYSSGVGKYGGMDPVSSTSQVFFSMGNYVTYTFPPFFHYTGNYLDAEQSYFVYTLGSPYLPYTRLRWGVVHWDYDTQSTVPTGRRHYDQVSGFPTVWGYNKTDTTFGRPSTDHYGWYYNGALSEDLHPSLWSTWQEFWDSNLGPHIDYYDVQIALRIVVEKGTGTTTYTGGVHPGGTGENPGACIPGATVNISGSYAGASISKVYTTWVDPDLASYTGSWVAAPKTGTLPTEQLTSSLNTSLMGTLTHTNGSNPKDYHATVRTTAFILRKWTRTSCPADFTPVPD